MDFTSTYLNDSSTNRFLLKFHDANLEREFWEERIVSRKKFFETTLLITILAVVLTSAKFMPYVTDVLPERLIDYDLFIRSLVLTPPLIAALIATRVGAGHKFASFFMLLGAILCGVSFSSLMLFVDGDGDGITYYNYAFLHVLVFMYILLLVPLRYTFPVALFLCVYHVLTACLIIDNLPLDQILFIVSPCVTMFAILTYAGYAIEKSERFNFIYRKALSNEYENRQAAQVQRSKWLGLVTDFLRHELKNSLIGVSSSLELISRKNNNEDLNSYIQRAGDSTGFMKRLLDEASSSTSLESALNEIQVEELNISSLLENKVEEYHDVYADYSFSSDIESNVFTSADSDRLVQALDKLVNNAVEHCDHDHPIRISLSRENDNIEIKVVNIGDAIKDDMDIFQPFVTGKGGRSNDNFGLGLFVVKRIVEAHGGTVASRGLHDPDGAEFTVSLPAQ